MDNKENLTSLFECQTQLLQTFLQEYCSVNGVKETDLANYVTLSNTNGNVTVTQTDTMTVLFSLQGCSVGTIFLKVTGSILEQPEKWVSTFKSLNDYTDNSHDFHIAF